MASAQTKHMVCSPLLDLQVGLAGDNPSVYTLVCAHMCARSRPQLAAAVL